MFFQLFENVSDKEKVDAIENLISHSSPRRDFFLLVILSISMATFGIILDSVVILIGSMLIAPVLYPVISLAMGIVMHDKVLVSKSFFTLFKSIVYALIASSFISLLFLKFAPSENSAVLKSIVDVNQSLIMYAIVAAIAGIAASFAMIKPHLNATLPGVAVTVSLVPPLAAIGYGIAQFDWTVITSFLIIFIINIAGIIFAGLLVFSLFDFRKKQKIAEKSIEKEERVLEKENNTVSI
jgi:uncharacterized hydrophobic protein (TIGR00271 family)